MKKYLSFGVAVMLAVALVGCGNSQTAQEQPPSSETTSQTEEKALAAYFAYSENVGDTSGMELDAIASASLDENTNNSEGNLQVMAQVLQEEKEADGLIRIRWSIPKCFRLLSNKCRTGSSPSCRVKLRIWRRMM